MVAAALAGPADTADALDRLEEVIELRIEDGALVPDDLLPAIVVSVTPRYESSQGWYATRALEALTRTLGDGGLRLCEACMAPRAYVDDGRLIYQAGPVGLDEIARLDAQSRGDAAPARAAIWLDEHRGGVSIRVVDLRTARVIFAQNVDPGLVEYTNTRRAYTLAEELERRARGDSVTQSFADFALYPGQHISLDWADQWGPRMTHLSGVTVSFFDPVLGVGPAYYYATPLLDILVGGKLILSVPTAATRSFGADLGDVLDPLLTLVGVVRVPLGRSNYGAVVTASTNGQVGLGVSFMNFRLLPVMP